MGDGNLWDQVAGGAGECGENGEADDPAEPTDFAIEEVVAVGMAKDDAGGSGECEQTEAGD